MYRYRAVRSEALKVEQSPLHAQKSFRTMDCGEGKPHRGRWVGGM